MANTFKQDLSMTMKMYKEYIEPVLPYFIKGKITVVEGNTLDETATMLDMKAGVDLFVEKPEGVTGIGSRIQVGKNWRTFTIRAHRDTGAKTEFEKRKEAIKNDLFFPKFTYQAYVSKSTGGQLLGLAVIKTKDLIRYIEECSPITRHTQSDKYGQASFFVCDWDDIKAKGFELYELNCETLSLKAIA